MLLLLSWKHIWSFVSWYLFYFQNSCWSAPKSLYWFWVIHFRRSFLSPISKNPSLSSMVFQSIQKIFSEFLNVDYYTFYLIICNQWLPCDQNKYVYFCIWCFISCSAGLWLPPQCSWSDCGDSHFHSASLQLGWLAGGSVFSIQWWVFSRVGILYTRHIHWHRWAPVALLWLPLPCYSLSHKLPNTRTCQDSQS